MILSFLLVAMLLFSATPVMAGTPQGTGGITVNLMDPVSTVTSTAGGICVNTVTDAVSPHSNMQFTLRFSGINTIPCVTESNIKLYKVNNLGETSGTAITVAITEQDGTPCDGNVVKDTNVYVTASSSAITASALYVLAVDGTEIKKIDSGKSIGSFIYYYISTNDGAAPDTTPPSWTSGSLTSTKTENSITLNWSAATDGAGVAEEYVVYQDGAPIVTTSALTTTATGLASGHSYTFTVKALDAAGNLSTDFLTLTEDVSFEGAFLGKTYGVSTSGAALYAGFEYAVDAAHFATLVAPATLSTTGPGIVPSAVPVTVSLINSDKAIRIVPQASLEYGKTYELSLSDQLQRTVDGSNIYGNRSFTFRTVDCAAPALQVLDKVTSAAAIKVEAGKTYVVKAAIANPQAGLLTADVVFVARSGKGTTLFYGGDASRTVAEDIGVNAGATQTVEFEYTVPANDSEKIYFDVYLLDAAGRFMSAPVHMAFDAE